MDILCIVILIQTEVMFQILIQDWSVMSPWWSVMSPGLVRDESMMISDESRTGQEWVHDD